MSEPPIAYGPTAAVLAACRTVAPTYDGRVPGPGQTIDGLGQPTGAHVILYGGAGTPTNRCYANQATADAHLWRIVAASNTPDSARIVAARIVAVLDGVVVDGDYVTVTYVSEPIEDRDDPTEWRWSATVEAVSTSRRGAAPHPAVGLPVDTDYTNLSYGGPA